MLFSLRAFSQSGWIRQPGLPGGVSINSVYFENQFTGWIAGSGGTILKTTNGGENWIAKNSGSQDYLTNIFFFSSDTGYVTGDSGTILKSTDTGENWLRQNSGTFSFLRSQTFVNNFEGYVVGNNNTFLKTTNGGTNWVSISLGDSIFVGAFDVKFFSQDIGWIAGLNTKNNHTQFFKTTNLGNVWFSIYDFGISGNVTSFYFITEQYGFLALENSANSFTTIYKTEDGGLNWIPSDTSIGPYAYIYFTDLNNGWYVGPSNQIFHTSNSGNEWTRQSIPPLPLVDFYTCYFIDTLIGWAGGSGNVLMKTTTGGVLTGFSNSTSEIPDRYFLSQNYPNPFNPITNITFGISKQGFITLKVYDVLGNEVSILNNGNMTAGNYEVNFDGSNLSSGMYFYRFDVDGSMVDTRRMLLLK